MNGDGYDSGDEDVEWVDEKGDEEELLDLECHPSFIPNVDKWRRKWEDAASGTLLLVLFSL